MSPRQVRGHQPVGSSAGIAWRPPHDRGRLPVLGVDIGGVIVDRVAENTDTSFFGERPLDTPAVVGAITALRELTLGPFQWRVFLVSKARRRTAETTRRWLDNIEFYERTGILRHNLHFVDNRRDKGPVCERLGVTHFVDDRVEVLQALTSVAYRYLFTGGLGENEPPANPPRELRVVDSWVALRHSILGTL
jgi:hypothetical protein